jgi:hypothetical protein
MSVAYWSVKLTDKPVQVQPPEGYVLNITQAALVNGKEGQFVTINVDTLAIEGDKLESVIGTLRAGKTEQFQLQLVFGYDVPTTFSLGNNKDGKAVVYLSGYYQPAPDDGESLLLHLSFFVDIFLFCRWR